MYVCVFMHSGQHNDSRMNLSIALTAAREGAVVANHVEVIALIKEKVSISTFFYT